MESKLILLFSVIFAGILSAERPMTFDLSDVGGKNYVTSVKSQIGGTCWTHGSMAAMESNMMITGYWESAGFTLEPNLAEYHLDWWNGFNLFHNEDAGPNPRSGLEVHYGGDYRVTAAYLSRGDGAVRDSDGQSFETAPPQRMPDFKIFVPRHIEWTKLENGGLNGIDLVKEHLMTRGALGTCMYASSQFLDDSVTWSFYQPPEDSNDPNHSIAIVGWNDTLTTHAPLPGAWLCKNSWGSGWGLNGYFWISYYDKHCGRHPEMGAVSFHDVRLFDYDQVYSHDYHGWRDTRQDIMRGFNLFVSRGRDTISAVGFYTTEDSVTAGFGLANFNGLNSMSIQQDTLFPLEGFHMLDVNDPLICSPGDSFLVYLEVDKGGMAYDKTSVVPVLLETSGVPALYRQMPSLAEVPSAAQENESYVYIYDDWYDLTVFDHSANLCIKAYSYSDSAKTSIEPVDIPPRSSIETIYPNPCNPEFTVEYRLSRSGETGFSLIDLRGKLVRDFGTDMKTAGTYRMSVKTEFLPSGIYLFVISQNGQTACAEKVLILK